MRNYIRKTKRRFLNEEEVKEAIHQVVENKINVRRVAESFNVPVNTLRRRIKIYQENKDSTGAVSELALRAPGFRKALSTNEERVFARYLKGLEDKLFVLTRTEVRKLAYEFAERYHPNHPFNRNEGMAGQDWLTNFIKRHPQVSIKKADRTSKSEIREPNEEAVLEFFSVLNKVMKKYNFPASRIYNAEETNVTIVSNEIPKLVSIEGKRLNDNLASNDNSDTVTAEVCFSASGMYMPMMIVFPRSQTDDKLLYGALPGTWAECHPSGCIQSDMFHRWLKNFIGFSGSSKENPVLLILNGHASYIKSLDVTDLAEDNGVIIVCLSSCIKHEILPIDVIFMKPFSENYINGVREWLRDNCPQVVTIYEIAALLGSAFLKTATPATAINGFSKTGIYPFNTAILPFSSHFTEYENNQTPSNQKETNPDNFKDSFINVYKEMSENTHTEKKENALEKMEENANVIECVETVLENSNEASFILDESITDNEIFHNLSPSSLTVKKKLGSTFTTASIQELKLEEGQIYLYKGNQLIPVKLDIILKEIVK